MECGGLHQLRSSQFHESADSSFALAYISDNGHQFLSIVSHKCYAILYTLWHELGRTKRVGNKMNEHILSAINAICDGFAVFALGGIVWLIRTITRLESDVNWIKQGIIFSGKASGMRVHSPHTPEFDRLLEAYWHGTLKREEVPEFMSKLRKASTDPSYDKFHQQFAINTLTALSIEYKLSPES